jgi:hypothetical protein
LIEQLRPTLRRARLAHGRTSKDWQGDQANEGNAAEAGHGARKGVSGFPRA